MKPILGLGLGTLVLASAAGCVQRQQYVQQELELNALREESLQVRKSLDQRDVEVQALREQVSSLSAERDQLAKAAGALRSTVEVEARKSATASAQVAEIDERFQRTQKLYEKLRETLSQVKEAASATAVELAELRLKRRELEERVNALVRSTEDLRVEKAKASQEAEEVRNELKRERVLVRSRQDLESESLAKVTDLSRKVEDLTRERKNLIDEKAALVEQVKVFQFQVGSLSAGSSGPPQAALSAAGVSGLYRDDPAGLWGEVAGFASARMAKLVGGDASWDKADFVLLGSALLSVCLVVWAALAPLRWLRRRRLQARLAGLQTRVDEAEVAALEEELQEVSEEGPSSPAPRRASVRRRARFSPILSQQGEAQEADGDAQATQEEVSSAGEAASEESADDEPIGDEITVNLGLHRPEQAAASAGAPTPVARTSAAPSVAPTAAGTPAAGPAGLRKATVKDKTERTLPQPVSAAGRADDEGGDQFACTQIIDGIGSLEGLGDLEPRTTPASKAAAQGKGVGGPVASGGRAPKSSAEKKGQKNDREFLDELKDMIGQKVDELIR
jgi:hypothetical protein